MLEEGKLFENGQSGEDQTDKKRKRQNQLAFHFSFAWFDKIGCLLPDCPPVNGTATVRLVCACH